MRLPNTPLVRDWLEETQGFPAFESQMRDQTELSPSLETRLLLIILVKFYEAGSQSAVAESQAALLELLDQLLRELLEIPAGEQGDKLLEALKTPWHSVDSLQALEMLKQDWLSQRARALILRNFCNIFFFLPHSYRVASLESFESGFMKRLFRIGYFAKERDWHKSIYFSRLLKTGVLRELQRENFLDGGKIVHEAVKVITSSVFFWFEEIDAAERDDFLLFLESLPLNSLVDVLCGESCYHFNSVAWFTFRHCRAWFFSQIERLQISEEGARVAEVLAAATAPARATSWSVEFEGLRILVERGRISDVVQTFRSRGDAWCAALALNRPESGGRLVFFDFLHHLLDLKFFDQAITILELTDNILGTSFFKDARQSESIGKFFDLVVRLLEGGKASQVLALLSKEDYLGYPLCHRMLTEEGVPRWVEPFFQASCSAEALKLLEMPNKRGESLALRVFMVNGRVVMDEFSRIQVLSESVQLSLHQVLMKNIPDRSLEKDFFERYSLLIEKVLGAVKEMLEENSGREQEATQRLAALNVAQLMDVLVMFKLGTPVWQLLTDILECLPDDLFLSAADREAIGHHIFLFASFQITARFLSLLSESERQHIVRRVISETPKDEAHAQTFAHAILLQVIAMTPEEVEKTYQSFIHYVLSGGEVPDVFKAMDISDSLLILKIVLLFVQGLVKQFGHAPSELKLWVDLAVKRLSQPNIPALPGGVEEKETRAAILDETACAMLLFEGEDPFSQVRVMDYLTREMPGSRSVGLMQSLSTHNQLEALFRNTLHAALASIELPFARIQEMQHFLDELVARRPETFPKGFLALRPVPASASSASSRASLVSSLGLLRDSRAVREERNMREEDAHFEQAAGRGGARFY